jgi:hypothetical protein
VAAWQRALPWLFLVVGLAYYVLLARGFPLSPDTVFTHVKSLTLIGAMQGALALVYTRLANHIDLGPGLRRLRHKVPSEGACPVRIAVRQEGVVTGLDEGYMWVEDGTLFYKGLQTVFRINREDVPPLGLWPRSFRPDPARNRPVRRIPIPDSEGDLWLEVTPIDPFEDYHARRRTRRFYRDVYDWLDERPRGSLETLLPPRALHPCLSARGPGRWEGVLSGAALVLTNVTLLATAPRGSGSASVSSLVSGLVMVASVGLLGLAVWLLTTQWRTVRLRDRLATELSSPGL